MLSGITCPWTCPTEDSRLCTYKNWMLGPQVAMLGHFWTCPFPSAACSAYCASEWAAKAAQGHWMLALCAKTKQIMYMVPARRLRR